MNDPGILRINLLESFEAMLAAIQHFTAQVRSDRQPAWVSLSEEEQHQGVRMRDKAADLYQALWYQDGQDGRETLTCPGIVGASAPVVEAALDCHRAKDAFKGAVLALKALGRADANTLMDDLHQRNEAVARAMERFGAARLNLKQAYRHVPLLDRRPVKIGFTWSRQGRTIQRTTVEEARRLLERRSQTPQVRLELARLEGVRDSEIMARIRPVCPHLRANVVFETPDGELDRRLIQAPLPILVPLEAGQPLPEFMPIEPQPTGSLRLQRSDVKIEEEPFLPTIRIHRYRPRYRAV